MKSESWDFQDDYIPCIQYQISEIIHDTNTHTSSSSLPLLRPPKFSHIYAGFGPLVWSNRALKSLESVLNLTNILASVSLAIPHQSKFLHSLHMELHSHPILFLDKS